MIHGIQVIAAYMVIGRKENKDMTKKELKEMTTEKLIWELGLRGTSDPMPTKKSRKEVDDIIKELSCRNIISYDIMIEEGKQLFLL